MGVIKYRTREGVFWKIDAWLDRADGSKKRYRHSRIPTKEQAQLMLAKAKAEIFEGKFFDKRKEVKMTVADLWADYQPKSKRENKSWRADVSYAKHLGRHLGDRIAARLTQADVDQYREQRFTEKTKRGGPPSMGQLDREVELLRRMLNYAVKCTVLAVNPLAGVALLDPRNLSNVRDVVVDEETFEKLLAAAGYPLDAVLAVAFDSGMRLREVLKLRWDQIDLQEATIRLQPKDTKEKGHRVIFLTRRSLDALRSTPRHLKSPFVFVNQQTGKPYNELRKSFAAACDKAGVPCGQKDGIVFHDLRRSFVTRARRAGVPESVVKRVSGHRTGEVFRRYNVVQTEDLRAARDRLEAQAVTSLDAFWTQWPLRRGNAPEAG